MVYAKVSYAVHVTIEIGGDLPAESRCSACCLVQRATV